MKLLYQVWHANSFYDSSFALLILICVLLGLAAARYLGKWLLRSFSRRAAAADQGVALKVLSATRLWLLSPVALYAAASALELPSRLEHFVDLLLAVALMLQSAVWLNCVIASWLALLIEKRHSDGDAATTIGWLGFVARIVVWTFSLLLILNHLNFNITALVTGLGVGGVAVALAVQNILGDLFASLSIVLDKPFVVGDFIVVGDAMGAVEHIGLKTTRVRSLGGELIVFSNTDLLKSRIHNYKRMVERRVVFTVGVIYSTPVDSLEQIPRMLREIAEAQRQVRLDRAHFKEFADHALIFEVVYYVEKADFNLYMDIQQEINLAIIRRFAQQGIALATPVLAVQLERKALPRGAAGASD